MPLANNPSERGMALVSVLAIIAIAATIVTVLLQSRATETTRTQSIESARQAYSLLQGIEHHLVGHLALAQDNAALFQEDGCRSPWVPLTYEGLKIEFQVENLHCRFNINAIGQSESANAIFVEMIDTLTLNASISGIDGRVLRASIENWTNPTVIAPYLTADGRNRLNAGQPFLSISELALLPEISGDEWRQLAGLLTALPSAEHGVDLQVAPAVLANALQDADADSYDNDVRFIQIDIVALLNDRVFRACTVLDLKTPTIILRENVPCIQ